ncbi:MAG: hypothetical protein AAB958_01875, partial [Patescibacteria group bacterium]
DPFEIIKFTKSFGGPSLSANKAAVTLMNKEINKLTKWLKTKESERAKNKDKGRLLWPLRVAITGLEKSPGPFEILEILGKKESLKRIEHAIKKLA